MSQMVQPTVFSSNIENKELWRNFQSQRKGIFIPSVLSSSGKGEGEVRETQNLKKGLQKSFPSLPETFPAGEMGASIS